MSRLTTLKPRIAPAQGRERSMVEPTQRQRGRTWADRRKAWFRRHPLCVICQAKGRVSAATELDHIVALINGGSDRDSNLQGLCSACHKDKTASDMGWNRRPEIGLDGWPTEGGR